MPFLLVKRKSLISLQTLPIIIVYPYVSGMLFSAEKMRPQGKFYKDSHLK